MKMGSSAASRLIRRRPGARRRSANVGVRGDLLEQAKELGINLSRALERQLAEQVRAAQDQRWLAENREAIEKYNRRVARRGVFSDELRRF